MRQSTSGATAPSVLWSTPRLTLMVAGGRAENGGSSRATDGGSASYGS
ncbi:MAG: hypothetical protein U0R64_05320 [Candidatus Nanopelagicales bacterium]